MDKELIENAALLFAGAGEFGELPYNPDAKNGFMAGAYWRTNTVWHDARKEVPEKFKPILVERDDFSFSVNMVGGNMASCPLHWVHWSYINDLLPEKKGGSL